MAVPVASVEQVQALAAQAAAPELVAALEALAQVSAPEPVAALEALAQAAAPEPVAALAADRALAATEAVESPGCSAPRVEVAAVPPSLQWSQLSRRSRPLLKRQ
jgi:hypothetical protein